MKQKTAFIGAHIDESVVFEVRRIRWETGVTMKRLVENAMKAMVKDYREQFPNGTGRDPKQE